ncbi:protein SCO1/2 [Marininema mesophilum]|uniref:Protein SCO1/2 n=1 Tax=Marininema mesophilum TaxID=1048340 RepID=A0A1H3BBD0_9BACL|nr:SCO family protein [Marininema mesophilum]SDX39085.1 protein SCO1/2 [Marininema mesophilum]
MSGERRGIFSIKPLTLIIAVALVAGVGWWSWGNDEKPALPSASDKIGVNSLPVPQFIYRDQDGKAFGMKELKGKVWLADMIFTRCPDICSPMTANMSRLQKKLRESGMKDVQLVSFSVDPLHDTSPVLKRYGKNLRADFKNWTFLTHDSEAQMERFLKMAFGSPIVRKESRSSDEPLVINHPARFYLMDKEGKIMAKYNAMQPDYQRIVEDVRSIQ